MSDTETRPYWLVPFIFVLSGATGLVYEVIWSRMLTTHVFGATSHAISTVLAAFMAGLALGAYWLARRADEMDRPLRFYAILEAGVAVYAFLFPLLIKGVLALYLIVARGTDPTAALGAFRFALAFALLLVPSTMMGATLPALTRHLARSSDEAGKQAGMLYAANTLGAVIGTLLAGFLLIRAFGVNGALFLTGAVNLAIGAVAWKLGREPVAALDETEPSEDAPSETFDRRIVTASVAAFGLSGFCALAYEVLWTRILVFFLGSTTYAFATMLAAFLTGIAVGSAVFSRRVGRIRRPALALGAVQTLIAIAAVALLPAFSELYTIVRAIGVGGRATVFLVCVLVMLLPTFLMGASFPLVTRIAAAGASRLSTTVGGVYMVNTVGSILGSLAAGFLLTPIFGIRNSVLLVALLNLVAAGWVLSSDGTVRTWDRYAPLGVGVAVVFIAFALFPKTQFFVKSAIYQEQFTRMGTTARVLSYEENADASVTVIVDPQGDRRLYVDTNEAANSSRWDAPSHRLIAHVPLLLHPDPKRALVVGFGMGRTSNSIIQHGTFVDAAEISPGVPKAARRYFSQWNHDVLDSPQFRLHINDGRNYILTTKTRYDMISTGIIHPLVSSGSSNIYSEGFYEMCRSILTEDGVMSQWVPLHRLPLEDFKVIIRTFLSVFPNTTVWYKYTPDFLILVGSKQEQRIDFRDWVARTRAPKVDAELAKDDVDTWSLLDSFFMGPEHAREFVGNGPIHTDNKPILEFFGSDLGGMMTTQAENIRAMLPYRESALPYLENFTNANEKQYVRDTLDRYFTATQKLIEGQIEFTRYEYERAVALYGEAARLNPDDSNIGYHQRVGTDLAQDELTAQVERLIQPLLAQLRDNPNDLDLIARVGVAYREAGDLSRAVSMFRRALQIAPEDVRLWFLLAETYHGKGDYEQAIEAFHRITAIEPEIQMAYGSLSEVYRDAGRIPEAVAALEKVLEIDPNSALAHQKLGSIRLSQGDTAAATRHFLLAITLDPDSGPARDSWYELGLTRFNQQRYDDARNAFENALEIDPTFGEARKGLQEIENLTAQAGTG